MKKPEDMKPQEINDEIKVLVARQSDDHAREYQLRLRVALDACPYKIGETLVNRRGEKARVDGIGIPSWRNEEYSLSGVYLKADGTPAMNPGRDNKRPRVCNFDSMDEWKRPA